MKRGFFLSRVFLFFLVFCIFLGAVKNSSFADSLDVFESAKNGSTDAMLTIGASFLTYGSNIPEGYDVPGYIVALYWFEEVAKAGDPEKAGAAIADAGFDYFLGSDDGKIEENDTAALLYFIRASEYGNPSAMNMMANFYTYGFGVDQDPVKALELLSLLALQNNPEALYSMEDFAYAYYAGTKDGIDINFGTAFQYYLKLTEFGNERAMYNVGLLYEYGLGVAQDRSKAIEWLTKAQDSGFEAASIILLQLNENQ